MQNIPGNLLKIWVVMKICQCRKVLTLNMWRLETERFANGSGIVCIITLVVIYTD